MTNGSEECICLAMRIVENLALDNSNTNGSNSTAYNRMRMVCVSEPEPRPFADVYQVVTTRIVLIICAFGLIGNILALGLLLIRRNKLMRHRTHQGNDTQSAGSDIACLVALFSSDCCFCAVVFPQWFMDVKVTLYSRLSFLLHYELYEGAIINTFVLSSTWLTVSMTVNRYLHLCHPLWALKYVGRQFSVWAISVSVIFSVIFNFPRFWFASISEVHCLFPENTTIYYIQDSDRPWEETYRWTYFVIGIMIPLCSLGYTNARIVFAVCHSFGLQQQQQKRDRNIITLTMIFVVFFYITLVSPAELLKFFERSLDSEARHDPYLLVNAFANLMQAINFSCNFVPYLILDKSIRHIILGLCFPKKFPRRSPTSYYLTNTDRTNTFVFSEKSRSKRKNNQHV